MQRSAKLIFISFVGIITVATSCTFESANLKIEKADSPKKPTLYGEWTARTIDSNLYDWTNLQSCKLLVYEYPDESRYASEQGQFIPAEFLIQSIRPVKHHWFGSDKYHSSESYDNYQRC
jgi:hypothetical protein